MARIEELAAHPQSLEAASTQLSEGVRSANPEAAYYGLARYLMVLVAGPTYAPNPIEEQQNRSLFNDSLQKSIQAINDGKDREAAREMRKWDRKWPGTDNPDKYIGTGILSEELMPVALFAVATAIQGLDESEVFLSPEVLRLKREAIKNHLNWASEIMSGKPLDYREFFGQGNVYRFIPPHSLTPSKVNLH